MKNDNGHFDDIDLRISDRLFDDLKMLIEEPKPR